MGKYEFDLCCCVRFMSKEYKHKKPFCPVVGNTSELCLHPREESRRMKFKHAGAALTTQLHEKAQIYFEHEQLGRL